MDTESLNILAVNTLCPAASNAIDIGPSPPEGPRGTFVTVGLGLVRLVIIDTESLSPLAVNTLPPAASNAIAIGPSPPEGARGTFVTVLELLARSIMDTESLP